MSQTENPYATIAKNNLVVTSWIDEPDFDPSFTIYNAPLFLAVYDGWNPNNNEIENLNLTKIDSRIDINCNIITKNQESMTSTYIYNYDTSESYWDDYTPVYGDKVRITNVSTITDYSNSYILGASMIGDHESVDEFPNIILMKKVDSQLFLDPEFHNEVRISSVVSFDVDDEGNINKLSVGEHSFDYDNIVMAGLPSVSAISVGGFKLYEEGKVSAGENTLSTNGTDIIFRIGYPEGTNASNNTFDLYLDFRVNNDTISRLPNIFIKDSKQAITANDEYLEFSVNIINDETKEFFKGIPYIPIEFGYILHWNDSSDPDTPDTP